MVASCGLGLGQAARQAVCVEDAQPEDLFPGFYSSLLQRLAMAEPR